MNKYFKTYIRSRQIVLNMKNNESEVYNYELNYIDLNSVDMTVIENIMYDNCIDPFFLYEKIGKRYHRYFTGYSDIIDTFFKNECSDETKSKHINLLQKNKRLINKIEPYETEIFLKYSPDVVTTEKFLGKKIEELFKSGEMGGKEIHDLYFKSVDHLNMDKVMSKYTNEIQNIDNDVLSFSYIWYVLHFSTQKNKQINRMLNNKNLIQNMDIKAARELIKFSETPEIINLLKKYRPDLNIE